MNGVTRGKGEEEMGDDGQAGKERKIRVLWGKRGKDYRARQ